jgi:hypothetical protein
VCVAVHWTLIAMAPLWCSVVMIVGSPLSSGPRTVANGEQGRSCEVGAIPLG